MIISHVIGTRVSFNKVRFKSFNLVVSLCCLSHHTPLAIPLPQLDS